MGEQSIDTLVVNVELDVKKFKEGHVQARAEFDKTKKSAVSFLQTLKYEASAAFGVMAGGYGFKALVENVTEFSASLGLLAHNLQVSTQDIQAWGNISTQFGGSAQAFQGTIANITSEFENLKLFADSSLLLILNHFRGLNQTDPFKFLLDLKQRIDDLNLDPREAKKWMDIAHIDTGTQNAMLNTTNAQFKELISNQQKKMLVDQGAADRAQNLSMAYDNLKQTLEGFRNHFVDEINPSIKKSLDDLQDYIEGHQKQVVAFFEAIAISAVLLIAPFVAAYAPVVALAVAFGSLYYDFKQWRENSEHILPWGTWDKELTEAKNKLIIFGDWLSKFKPAGIPLFNDFSLGITNITSLLDGMIAHVKYGIEDLLLGLNGFIEKWNQMFPNHQMLKIGWGDDAQLKREAEKEETIQNSNPESQETWEEGVKKESQETWEEGVKKESQETWEDPVKKLLEKGEAKTYTAVHLGVKKGGDIPELTEKTFNEVSKDQDNKKYYGAGKYQGDPDTVKEYINKKDTGEEKFDKKNQDKFYDYLINEKRSQIGAYTSGKSDDLHAALVAISKEFASIANPDTGKSFYKNATATITSEQMADALQKNRDNNLAKSDKFNKLNPISSANASEKTANEVNIDEDVFKGIKPTPKDQFYPKITDAHNVEPGTQQPDLIDRLHGKLSDLKTIVGGMGSAPYAGAKPSEGSIDTSWFKDIKPTPKDQVYPKISDAHFVDKPQYSTPQIAPIQQIQQSGNTTNNANPVSNDNSSQSKSEVTIGSITIKTNATDAQGIAGSINNAITHQSDFGTR